MIVVTRLDGAEMIVNADLIESVEGTPDTLLTLSNGSKLLVRESSDEIVARAIAFKQVVLQGVPPERRLRLVRPPAEG